MRSSDFPVIVSPAASAALSRGYALGGNVSPPSGATPMGPGPSAPGALNSAAAPPDPTAVLQKVAADAANACGRLVQALRVMAGPNAGAVDAAAANLRQALLAVIASAHPGQGGGMAPGGPPAPAPMASPAPPPMAPTAPAPGGALQ